MFLKLYFIALPVFFAIDMVWLGLVAKNFYAKYIGFLMAPNVNWVAAIIFYLLFIVGAVIFVIMPALDQKSWMQVLTLHDACPWPPLSPAGVALRKGKAWFVYHAWTSPAARVRYHGVCGHFEGRLRR